MSCVFCQPPAERVFHNTNTLVYGLWDGFPVSAGHALVIPRRHVANWFDATTEEQASLLEGIEMAKKTIESSHTPDGYNIGINIGAASGQTVPHLHVHIIPRYAGDVEDPRGGVRHVIPDKGNYLLKENQAAYSNLTNRLERGLFGPDSAPMLETLRHDLSRADRVDIAVAFVFNSGLEQIETYLVDVVTRGGRVRLLTGDYMAATEPRALRRLLDLKDASTVATEIDQAAGTFDCKVFETSNDIGFHPKAYLIGHQARGHLAYIGSSNLSRAALQLGVEWNYRLTDDRETRAVKELQNEFETLFFDTRSAQLTESWIKDYEKRYRQPDKTALPVDPDQGQAEPPPTPHRIQRDALSALEHTRQAGNCAGLVVLATGLGKTWLSAFDSETFKRVLFVAHREEILTQARSTYRRICPDASLGLYNGQNKDDQAQVLFASIQTLGRAQHLDKFPVDAFDYIVVDEFHHAAAKTYTRLIDHFEPDFLLGLTATPDRSDGADLLSLCGENLVFRCDVAEGIENELLSPFYYYGIPDLVDFQNIPWRSGRFDPHELQNAVITESRARNALDEWGKRKGERTLAFCVSQRHADYMAEYFRNNQVRAVAVHSGPGSAPRSESLSQLEAGGLDVVFAVDMFNEGVDVPHIDTVLMLRPSESKILWLQQFGRGLRRAQGKSHLRVIDYIGNHRTFLQAAMALLHGADAGPGALHMALQRLENDELQLPPGCEITYELEALDILKNLARPSRPADATRIWYQSFKEQHGIRPTASEAWHAGYDPGTLRKGFGSWPGFVDQQGDLDAVESQAFAAHKAFLTALETTKMDKSYKMLVLITMITRASFPGEIHINELVAGVRHLARKSGLLQQEFQGKLNDDAQLTTLLKKNPITAWTGDKAMGGDIYFTYENNIFKSTFSQTGKQKQALVELTRELCEYRLGQYLERLAGNVNLEQRNDHEVGHANDRLMTANSTGPILWQEYMRQEIPPLWGYEFSTGNWNQGFVRKDNHVFLLVSLEKKDLQEAHQYDDQFIAPDVFQWISQNQHSQDGKIGQLLNNHENEGIKIHLFVRTSRKNTKGKAAPFIYCGELAFINWQGSKPITIQWRLFNPLPGHLLTRFDISAG